MFSWSQMHWESESSRTHPDAAIKCFLANYLPVQLFTSCGGFMLNPVISLALQLSLSMSRSQAERLQSAFYYTTLNGDLTQCPTTSPLWFLCELAEPFPINHRVPVNFLLFFLSFQLYYFVCVCECTLNINHTIYFSL